MKKAIAVYGGSFNPPLYSHFSLAQQVCNERKEVEKVIFVPVNCKYKKEGLIENKHRFQMLKLVIDKNPLFELSAIEMESKQAVYTIEVLQKIQKRYPHHFLYFLLGTDNLKLLETWKQAEQLVENFSFLVLERDTDCLETILEENTFLNKHKQAFIKLQNTIHTNMSASYVREKIKKKESIRYLTEDSVCEYIQKYHLYE